MYSKLRGIATEWTAVKRAAALDVETDVDDVAVLHDVIAAFQTQGAAFTGFGPGAGGEEVVEGDDLGTDEAAGDVGVNRAGGVEGRTACAQGPGARLLFVAGEEGDEAE